MCSPEINLKGNNVSIVSGDDTPSVSDSTDFGEVVIFTGNNTNTFTIENLGTADLTLSGMPRVTISGVNASDFTVTQPTVSSVAAGGSTTFQIKFTPLTTGVRIATVSIASNDADENPYTFAISGLGGLDCRPLPPITDQPVSQTVCLNNEAVLEVGINGPGVAFQWQIDTGSGFQNVSGGEYAGVNSKRLVIKNFDQTKSGKPYRCLVSTNCFQTFSDPATVTLTTDFVILSEPRNQTVCEFGSARFVLQAIKLTPGGINYQWQRKQEDGIWVNVTAGGNYAIDDSVLVINNVPANWNNVEFRCVMNNSCQSFPAKVLVTPVANVTQNPVNVEICTGNNANFTIKASGQGLTYRWQVNSGSGFTNIVDGGIYQGTTTTTLQLLFPTAAVNNYQYRCVVTGTSTCDLASATSGVASISVGVSAEAQTIFWNSTITTAIPITQAVGYILAVNSIVQPNGKAEYRAGNAIILNPGFEAQAGAVFSAKIMNPCQNVTISEGGGKPIPKELVK